MRNIYSNRPYVCQQNIPLPQLPLCYVGTGTGLGISVSIVIRIRIGVNSTGKPDPIPWPLSVFQSTESVDQLQSQIMAALVRVPQAGSYHRRQTDTMDHVRISGSNDGCIDAQLAGVGVCMSGRAGNGSKRQCLRW